MRLVQFVDDPVFSLALDYSVQIAIFRPCSEFMQDSLPERTRCWSRSIAGLFFSPFLNISRERKPKLFLGSVIQFLLLESKYEFSREHRSKICLVESEMISCEDLLHSRSCASVVSDCCF